MSGKETAEERLENIDIELGYLKWSMERDSEQYEKLEREYEEVCGDIGHDWDESHGTSCINCGYWNPQSDVDYEAEEDEVPSE